ncbi:MAG: riboflavin synthase [bacterium]|nr:riboflavin synthase [bacterium]
MFTGIIRYQGKLTKHIGNELTIAVPRAITTRLKPGGSIAVNGVCLTVEAGDRKQKVWVSLMPETAQATTLEKLPIGSKVNLELPLRLGDPLDGHLVSGHVDGVGAVKIIQRRGNSRTVTIAAPRALARYLAPKGSVALDGVSLTIQQSRGAGFTVGLIPETIRRTTLQTLRIGSRVNIEIDIVARYLEHFSRV